MWLDFWHTQPLIRDWVATVITLILALTWLRFIDRLVEQDILEPKLSRKIIHIGTGPLFVLCWNLFSPAASAPYLAALVPLAITLQFAAIGLGWIQDPAAVQAMTRTGNPGEILRGPLYYGILFIVCTVVFWRQSPVGMLALMLMCGGDGLADIIGRRWGKHKLPFNPDKSWVGSTAMFLGSFSFGFGFLLLFNALGYFQPSLKVGETAIAVAMISLVATLVEALPFRDIDNLTLTLTALALGVVLL